MTNRGQPADDRHVVSRCPLCSSRPARRACPALGQTICAVCCGTKRLVEIRCVDDCQYLASARRHPPAIVQRQHELDLALLMPAMAGFTERQSRFFFLFQSLALRHAGDPLRPLIDSDVAEAAASGATLFEAAARGLIYEPHPPSLNAQELLAAYRRTFDEVAAHTGGPRTPLEKDAARALRGLEEAARRVGPIVGDAGTGFLSLARRVLGSGAARGEESASAAERSGLILP